MTKEELEEKTKKLEKAFQRFIKKIYGIKIKVRFGEDFAYYHDENEKECRITITLGVPESNGFMEDLMMRYKVDVDVQHQGLFYLLHELGHHFTWDDLSKEVHEHCDIMKKELERILNGFYTDDAFKYLYFGCIDEMLATQWACAEFLKITQYNTKEISKLVLAIENFYKECGIEEEETGVM